MDSISISRRTLVVFGSVGMALAVLGTFAFMAGLEPSARAKEGGYLLLALNCLVIPLALRKGVARRAERAAWFMLAASMVPLLVANVLLTRFGIRDWVVLHGPAPLFAACQLLAGAMQGAALFLFPWAAAPQGKTLSARTRNVLASLLFPLFMLAMVGLRPAGFQSPTFLGQLEWVSGIRIALLGTLVAYRVSQRPARVFGPLGWLFLYPVGQSLTQVLLHATAAQANQGLLTVFVGVVVIAPLSFCVATLDPAPAEPPGLVGEGSLLGPVLLLLPFMGTSAAMMAMEWRSNGARPEPVVAFLAQVAILVAILIMAVREIYRVNERLETEVWERTRALQEAQAIVLRTERLNSVAVLGSGAVHNLNNIHQIILGCAERLDLAVERGAPISPSLSENLLDASTRAASLTKTLMAYSRERPVSTEALDLVPLAREVGAFLQVMMPRRVVLQVEADAGALRVDLPRDQVEQILVNLVVNARDAVGSEGRIRIGLGREGAHAVMAVSDTGCGMSPEVQARIFEPLFTTKPEGQGTGLGLPSIKAYIESVHGGISVESTQGWGTKFRVLLPLGEPV